MSFIQKDQNQPKNQKNDQVQPKNRQAAKKVQVLLRLKKKARRLHPNSNNNKK